MKKIVLPWLLIFISFFVYGQKNKVTIASTPEWVATHKYSTNERSANNDGSGYYYQKSESDVCEAV